MGAEADAKETEDAPPPSSCAAGLDKFSEVVDAGLLSIHDAIADGLYTVHVQTKELIKTHASVLSPSGSSSTAVGPKADEADEEDDTQHLPDLHLRVQVTALAACLS